MAFSLTAQLELRPDLQIIEFDSATYAKSYRVELQDGRHFQINEKLYHLLDILRVPTPLTALASAFQQRTGQSVTLDELQQIGVRLAEQGIIVEQGQPVAPTTPPAIAPALLGFQYRRDILSPEQLAPVVNALQFCFQRPVALLLTLLIVSAHIWAYRILGFPPDVDLSQISFPLYLGVTLISIALHELGHLAACRRWNCTHGPLGIGLYFFMPVPYVDVTAAWRLTRQQRAVVDIGGVYLQALVVPVCLALYLFTQDLTFLLLVVSIDLLLLGNLEPFMKLDGYWLLSDLAGVPNLHTRTWEAVRTFFVRVQWWLRLRRTAPTATPFAQWSRTVRGVVLVYVLLSALLWPMMILLMAPLLFQAVTTYPLLWRDALATLWTAGSQSDYGAIFGALSNLFVPTSMLLALVFSLKSTVVQLWNLRRAKAQTEQLSKATVINAESQA